MIVLYSQLHRVVLLSPSNMAEHADGAAGRGDRGLDCYTPTLLDVFNALSWNEAEKALGQR